jgi:hypothetical protein
MDMLKLIHCVILGHFGQQEHLENLKCGAGEGWRRSVGPIM